MIGTTISHYKIIEKLGEGGMGVVYKAEDTNLKRPVALKFLAAHLLGDEGVKERFRREAEATAALTHANIAVIHDINESDGHSFIAMEFVEGPTVGEKVGERPLKLEEALDIAIQAVQGLQAAHEKDIVHRDIKSANLMVTPQGQVKIMDFGLAQLAERSKLTETTTILGTPCYMSPEQAVGEKTDRRTDLWSLGVVLYEMVTGRLPFEGERQEAVLYGITNEEPEPVTALRAGLPMELEWIVGKALAKDREERYQHAEDLLVDLRSLQKKLASGTPTISHTKLSTVPLALSEEIVPKRRLRFHQGLLAVTVMALLVLAFVHFRETRPEAPVRKFSLTPPVSILALGGSTNLSVSPNGRHVAFTAAGPQGKLWIQDLDWWQPRAIEGTEGARGPFWSPDSEFIGFAVGGELKKVSVQGGLAIRLCELPGVLLGATWSPDGNSIVFSSPNPYALYEVPARGGAANLLISPEEPSSGGPWGVVVRPHFLPLEAGGRVLVFAFGSPTNNTMMVQDLETDRREILGPGNFPAYSSSGHLLYQPSFVTHEIWALPFSLDTLQATGEAFPIAENGRRPTVASDGTLVYLDHIPLMSQLGFVDRAGAAKEQIGQPMAEVRNLALSPDGRRVAFSVVQDSNQDIWIHDLARNLRNRLTTAPERDWVPVWSPKGDEVALSSRSNRGRSFDIFRQRVDGTGEREVLVGTPVSESAGDWSADGKYLIYRRMDPQTRADLWYLLREGEDWTPHTFLQTSADEGQPRFSPDSRYVAYVSDQSGRREVYVRSFPEGETVSRISRNGGVTPRWSPNGKELFYVEGTSLMAVPVSMSPSFSPGEPTRLFDAAGLSRGDNSPGYDVSPDGRQFIIAQSVSDSPRPSIRVVQNWYEEFRDREQD